MNLDFYTILYGVLFGLVGIAAWQYGRRQASGRHMLLGVALMCYGYFVPGKLWSLLVGVVLTALLFWP